MWPWEHLAVAYVLYSLGTNVVRRRSPSTPEAIAVVAGSQFPDLVDKPLAWTLGITETGNTVGHSLFVAPLVCLAVYLGAVRRGVENRLVPVAFVVAYLSHLATDVYDPTRTGREFDPRVVLWPIDSPPANDHGGLIDHFGVYFFRYVNGLVSGGLTPQIALQLALGVAVVALWLSDGAPIAADGWRWLRRRLSS